MLKDLENILISRRNYISREPKDENVVVIASGGLDSTALMGMLMQKYNCNVYPLFVRRHSKAMPFEEVAFNKISGFYAKEFNNNYKDPLKIEVEVPPLSLKKGLNQHRLDTVGHALRNVVLQSIGVQYAVQLNDTKNLNIKSIFAGSIGDDSFPHNFIEAFRIITLQTCWDLNDWDWQVTSPFVDEFIKEIPKYKKDVIQWAMGNNIPVEYTRTCTLEDPISCGVCGDCVKRRNAFKNAGFEDPIEYKVKDYENA